MPFSIVRNNIVDMQVDAVVNTANPKPIVGSGVDTAIHKAAGPKLLEARREIGMIPRGSAAITHAFDLPAKYVIHTVGPVWEDGTQGDAEVLKGCYRSSLNLALDHGCESIAFPLISSGNYGFPKDLALQTAITTISSFLMEHEMMVYLVVFDKKAYALSEKLFQDVESYIDENLIEEIHEREYRSNRYEQSRRWEDAEYSAQEWTSYSLSVELQDLECEPSEPKRSDIPDFLIAETFSEALLRMIDERGMTDPEVYKRANVSKAHFYKIRKNKFYQPTKKTALALAIAMKLNLDDTKDLIGKAGFMLTPSSKFDLIIEYFVKRGNYDIFEINEVLFEFTEQVLIGEK